MINYQYALREDNARKLATRGVNTSFLLFPVRLETKFKEKEVNEIYEPNRVYYTFCAIWAVLRTVKYCSHEKVLKKIYLLKEEMENLDLLYKEDKAHLRLLLDSIQIYLPTDESKEVWQSLKGILEKAPTSSTLKDKNMTRFLDKMDRMTRRLMNTIYNPPYGGTNRLHVSQEFSHTIYLRTALKRFKEFHTFLKEMEDELRNLPTGATKQQVAKFNLLLSKWKEQTEDIKVLHSDQRTYIIEKRNLLGLYHIDLSGKYAPKYKSGNRPLYIYEIPKQAKIAADHLYEFVNSKFLPTLMSFNFKRMESLMLDKVKYVGVKNSHRLLPQRYTALATSLMHIYARNYVGIKGYKKENLEKKLNTLALQTYFNFSSERRWTEGLLQVVSKKLGLDVNLSNLNNNSQFIRNAQMGYIRKQKCLCVRIYPDVVALTQLAKPLTTNEFEVAKDFWLKYIYSNDDSYRSSLWLAICDLYAPYRAAYILKQVYPKKTGFNALKALATRYKSVEEFLNAPKVNDYFDKTIVVDSKDIFTVPITNLMPERFALHAVLNLSEGKKQNIWRFGHILPSQLQVGLDLNNLENSINEKASKAAGQLYLNGNLRWMTDYDLAEQMGMAITVPLKAVQQGRKHKDRVFDFSAIYVYGINEVKSDECSKILQELLESRLYSNESLELISSDMPTNILRTEDESHKYDTSIEAQRERFKHLVENCVNPKSSKPGEDARILEDLLCLKNSFFSNLTSRDSKPQKEIARTRRVNEKLLELVPHPLIKFIKDNSVLSEFFINDVLPRGPFPIIRISNQPYGILPACDFNMLTFRRDREMYLVKKIIVLLTKYWNNIVDNHRVAYDGDDTKNLTDKDYLSILNSTPSTTTFWKRKMVKNPHILKPEYFRGEYSEFQLKSLTNVISLSYPNIKTEDIKDNLLNYISLPLLDKDEKDFDRSVIMSGENINLQNLISELRKDEELSSKEISDEKLEQCIIEFFDLFNYRLDAWLTGMLSNKLRTRMDNSRHSIALGCFGWIFNLKQTTKKDEKKKNEYILAPSVNQAITGAVLRSSYNNSLKNKEREYSASVNLSSERVRSAIRIIEGVQNGLSVGCILGSDLERLVHEAYKINTNYEMDSCIYPLRTKYPLITQSKDKGNDITVLNGTSLLKDYREAPDKLKWIQSLNLFAGTQNINVKEIYLFNIIDRIDDEFDALTDVILSESVYKLTQGNIEAVEALTQAMDEMKNIPLPDVVNIPITSAQIDGHMVVALDVKAKSQGEDVLSNVEPKVDAWIEEMLGAPSKIGVAFSCDNSGDSNWVCKTLGELGISASEIVYLSSNTEIFNRLLKILYWLNEGEYPLLNLSMSASDFTLQEVQLAADDMRQLLSESRMLRNEDMVKETGHSSNAEYDTAQLAEQYNRLCDYVEELCESINGLLLKQSEQQNPLNPDYKYVAMSDSDIFYAIEKMVSAFRLGQMSALDGIEPGLLIGDKDIVSYNKEYLSTVEKQHSFFQKVTTVMNNLSSKLAEAKAMVEDVVAPSYKEYQDAISHMLVADFLVIPTFRPDENVDSFALGQQCRTNRFANIDAMGIEDLLSDLALVEQPMMYLNQLRIYGKCNELEVGKILPVQFPYEAGDNGKYEWLGTKVSDESHLKDAFVYMIMNPENMVYSLSQKDENLAGIVLDHWIERIPYRSQTAAVAFNYDQPDAEAPQSLLLAVSTKDYFHKWSEMMMLNSMKSAVHMVKCRAVNPEMLSNDRWTSGIFPLMEYKDLDNNVKN